VIVDQDGNVSLISIFQGITVPASVTAIPENAALAMRWNILTLWQRLAEDEGRNYEQQCDLLTPSGQKVVSTLITFSMTDLTHRNIAYVWGMPVREFGAHTLRLVLREVGDPKDTEIAAFPIMISRQAQTG
jgi:hypothetical protein